MRVCQFRHTRILQARRAEFTAHTRQRNYYTIFTSFCQDIYSIFCDAPEQGFGLITATKMEDDNRELTLDEIRDTPDSDLFWTLSYTELIAPLVAVVQHQKKEIDELRNRLDNIEV